MMTLDSCSTDVGGF